MRRGVVVCAITVSALMGPSARAELFNAADLDQRQESQNYGYGVGGSTWMAQTFTAGKTGTLYGVEIGNTTGGVVWDPMSPPVVQIFAGEPGSTGFGFVANPVSPPSHSVPSNDWLPVDFKFFVHENWTYSIVVRAQTLAGAVSVGATTNDSYSDGALWVGDNGTDWVRVSNTDTPVYDMQFHTHVVPVPLPAGVWLGILGLSAAGWRLRRRRT